MILAVELLVIFPSNGSHTSHTAPAAANLKEEGGFYCVRRRVESPSFGGKREVGF
jgi:hypothetical protein